VGSNPAGRAINQALSQSCATGFLLLRDAPATFAPSYPLEAPNSVMLGVALAAEILFDAATGSPISAAEQCMVIAVHMPQEQLACFEADSSGPQSASMGMLHIVDAYTGKGQWARPAKCCFILRCCFASCACTPPIRRLPHD
jgi:hypothetical protein